MTIEPSIIHVLSSDVSEKIAAGEVIERPSSVVKELVENSLDAGSTRIDIALEDAGFSLIRISDSGSGMAPGNLEKCLLRHATSKIQDLNDLFSVSTFGFRGEALASISAVARTEIISSNEDSGLGHRILSEGGRPSVVEPCRRARGTTVSCRDIFFNVPARKKFMKSRKSERMTVARLVEQLAIPHPSVHFTLTVDGKSVVDCPPTADPRERIAQIAGPGFAKKLIECESDRGDVHTSILISPPSEATSRPRFQYLYINLRRVDNDSVTYAVREAFSRFIVGHLKPAWFCFLDVDPTEVDVNVHPTKLTAKFSDEKELFSTVFHCVRDGLTANSEQGTEAFRGPHHDRAPLQFPGPKVEKTEANTKLSQRPAASSSQSSGRKSSRNDSDGSQTSLSFFGVFDANAPSEDETAKHHPAPPERLDLISCYQIHKMYILAPIKNGVFIIDQHAAHERILYEEAVADLQKGGAQSQRMLFPMVIELTQAEKSVVLAGREYFASMGFDIQDFGGTSLAVSAAPAAGIVTGAGVEEAVREMVQFLLDEKNSRFFSEPQKRYAAAFACGSAIKAGQELKQEEMNMLLNGLFAAENPYTCPHGRPTVVRISLDELKRRFLR